MCKPNHRGRSGSPGRVKRPSQQLRWMMAAWTRRQAVELRELWTLAGYVLLLLLLLLLLRLLFLVVLLLCSQMA